ncbi:hypothetical protein FJ251_06625 [bacterium]|nr:hypothetical protein [bacterium]
MNSPRFGVWLLAALLLAVACDGDSERRLTPPPADYLPNDSPDNLVLNVVKAWETMDAAGYAALLYDGVLEADDGEVYAPFKFYYDRSLDPSLPEIDLYDRELVRTAAMLGGEPGDGVPGIEDVEMTLMANGLWQTVAGGVVDDDPCPENAQWRSFETDMTLTLESTIGGSDIYIWLVEDRLIFHCLPILVDGETEWRLWKWRDILTLRTEDASFSQIRALY